MYCRTAYTVCAITEALNAFGAHYRCDLSAEITPAKILGPDVKPRDRLFGVTHVAEGVQETIKRARAKTQPENDFVTYVPPVLLVVTLSAGSSAVHRADPRAQLPPSRDLL
jgi:hypothetical protein